MLFFEHAEEFSLHDDDTTFSLPRPLQHRGRPRQETRDKSVVRLRSEDGEKTQIIFGTVNSSEPISSPVMAGEDS